jgi:hypothetical protein
MRLLRFRFSLLGLMAVVAYVAVACAAVRYSTELWASGLFTLAVVLQMVAVVCVACRSESAWAGFLVFGGGYLLLALGPWSQSMPPLITSHGITWLDQKLHGEAPQTAAFAVSGSPWVKSYTTVNASQILLWDATTGRSLNANVQPVFQRIGHSLLSPLFGLLGALATLWLYGRTKEREVLRSGADSPIVKR